MIRTRYGSSPWIEAVSPEKRPDFPAYKGKSTAPVVIVGAGMAGCMTAYACAAAGVKAVVLEAGRIGTGGSGRNAGYLAGEAAESFVGLQASVGRRAARALFDASQAAPKELAAAVKHLRINAGFELRPSIRVLSPGQSDKALRREAAERASAGLVAAWLTPAAVSRETMVPNAGGLQVRSWGVVDPYRLTIGFAAAAARRGARCFERSRVTRIDFDRRQAVVTLERGEIVAGTVIVCTGEPTGLFKALRRHFRYEDRYAVMTDALPAPIRARLGSRAAVLCDVERPQHQLWFTSDGRAVFSGADQKPPPPRLRDKALIQRTGQLMYELTRLYPDISGVLPVRGWDVPLAHSADDVLYAGPHRNFPHQLFAFGTLHDAARAFLASRILVRRVLGRPNREDEHFGFARNL